MVAKTKPKPLSAAGQRAIIERLGDDWKNAFVTDNKVKVVVQKVSVGPVLAHNPHMMHSCDCVEFHESHGFLYCNKCWPLPGDCEPEDWTDFVERCGERQDSEKEKKRNRKR